MTHLRIRLDGRVHEVELTAEGRIVVDGVEMALGPRTATGARAARVQVDGVTHEVERRSLSELSVDGVVSTFLLEDVRARAGAGVVGAEGAEVRPPMPGKVVRLRVAVGDTVEQGQVLFVLEAMKMQNEVTSPAAGMVRAIRSDVGASVDTGDVVVVLGPPTEADAIAKVVA